ncbi:MAG TPA: trypsin-like serine protease [Polyangiaceae bacterium]|nr:trypsin-like serine protease [Polyangiaceae bacterium]
MRFTLFGRRSRRALVLAGCSVAPAACNDAASSDPASGPRVDVAEPVAGVADRGGDPAVVAIDVAGRAICTGALLAPDVVVTARHCVSPDLAGSCPDVAGDLAPSSLRVLVGEDTGSAVEGARGRALFVPDGDAVCGADVALLALDRPIDGIRTLAVRPTGAAQGARLRTVGYEPYGGVGLGAVKIVRDHVRVVDTTDRELRIAERAVEVGGGGPALDETSGEIVGVVSRAAGADGTNVYTRTDAFLSLVAQALAQGSPAPSAGQKARKGPADMGARCALGADCAAGVCVTVGDKEYCSRPCAAADRCPAHFRCERGVAEGAGRNDSTGSSSVWACVEQ